MKKNASVLKRTRQAQKAALRNRHYVSMMKTSIKKVKNTKTKAEAEPLFKAAVALIDRSLGKVLSIRIMPLTVNRHWLSI